MNENTESEQRVEEALAARMMARCPLPSRWLAVTSGKAVWSDEDKEHFRGCDDCQRVRARWQWSREHPALWTLLKWKLGKLRQHDQLAVDIHVDHRNCDRCRRLVDSPWFGAFLASINSPHRAFDAAKSYVERIHVALAACEGMPAHVVIAPQPEGFAATTAESIFSVVGSDDRFRVQAVSRDSGWVLGVEHPEHPPGTLLKVTLAPSDVSQVQQSFFIMLRQRYRGPTGGSGELGLGRFPLACSLAVVALMSHNEFTDDDAPLLVDSFKTACRHDPAAVRFWKDWCSHLFDRRTDLSAQTLARLDEIIAATPRRPDPVFTYGKVG